MTFEEKIKRIEEIQAVLESGKASLEDALKLYEEGMLLSKDCLETIDKSKGKIVEIKKSIENTIEEQDMQ